MLATWFTRSIILTSLSLLMSCSNPSQNTTSPPTSNPEDDTQTQQISLQLFVKGKGANAVLVVVKDGQSDWQPLDAVEGRYETDITSETYGLALICPDTPDKDEIHFFYATPSELNDFKFSCDDGAGKPPARYELNGTVSGISSDNDVVISAGEFSNDGNANPTSPDYMMEIAADSRLITVMSRNAQGVPQRMLFKRDVTIKGRTTMNYDLDIDSVTIERQQARITGVKPEAKLFYEMSLNHPGERFDHNLGHFSVDNPDADQQVTLYLPPATDLGSEVYAVSAQQQESPEGSCCTRTRFAFQSTTNPESFNLKLPSDFTHSATPEKIGPRLIPTITVSDYDEDVDVFTVLVVSKEPRDYYWQGHVTRGWLDKTGGDIRFPDPAKTPGWQTGWSLPAANAYYNVASLGSTDDLATVIETDLISRVKTLKADYSVQKVIYNGIDLDLE